MIGGSATNEVAAMLHSRNAEALPSVPIGEGRRARLGGRSDLERFYDHLIGQTLADRFEVLELSGMGGMGAVYYVQDLNPPAGARPAGLRADGKYALKVRVPEIRRLSPVGALATPDPRWEAANLARRFRWEFRMAQRRLSREGRVARAYEFGTAAVEAPCGLAGGKPVQVEFFTMDPVVGGHLPIPTEPQPPEMVAALGLELFSALDDLHARNIVHRDVKFENLRLTEPWREVRAAWAAGQRRMFPRVVLVDLGLAKHCALRDVNPLGTILGTGEFLPPEARVIGNFDPRVDLYAAGVVLYWLATGQHPYVALGCSATHASMSEPLTIRPVEDLVPGFPKALARVIKGLLEADPARRPTTAALAHDLFSRWWEEEPRRLWTQQRMDPLAGKPYLCQPRFIGRRDELASAQEFLEDVAHYRVPYRLRGEEVPHELRDLRLPAGVLAITGDPGIGKSRFLAEVVSRAEKLGFDVLQGQCLATGGVPEQGVDRILGDLGELDGGASESEAVGKQSGWEERCARFEHLPVVTDPGFVILDREARSLEDERAQAEAQRRFKMETALAQLLRAGRASPVLVVLEDSQWADESSEAVLDYLLEGVALARRAGHPARVAFVLTCRARATERDPGVERITRLLAEAERRGQSVLSVSLGEMTQDEVPELCASMLQVDAPGFELARFTEALFGDRPTHPIYVEQVLWWLLDRGVLTEGMFKEGRDGPRWTGKWNLDPERIRSVEVPPDLSRLIDGNIERLSSGTSFALMVAAAEGPVFDVTTVARASGYEVPECLEFLDEAMSAGYVRNADEVTSADRASSARGRSFAFAHDRFREALLTSMDGVLRRQCHANLASAYRALRADDPKAAESLARHLDGAGEYREAFQEQVRAAGHATRLRAHDRAVELYEQALAIALRAGMDVEPGVREALVSASISAGRYDVAEEQLRLLDEEEVLPPRMKARVNLTRAELLHRRQDYRNAIEPLKRALRALGERYPRTFFGRELSKFAQIVPQILYGKNTSRVMKRTPARDEEMAALRARAWYSLTECLFFVDTSASYFSSISLARRALTSGLHSYLPIAFSTFALGASHKGFYELARENGALARELVTDRVKGDGQGAEPVVQAIVEMHLQGRAMFSGELGARHAAALAQSLRDGLQAASRAGDPQRLWTCLVMAACLHYQMGHLRSFESMVEYLCARAVAQRVFYIEQQFRHRKESLVSLTRRCYALGARSSYAVAELGKVSGDQLNQYTGLGTAHWASALILDPGAVEAAVRVASDALETGRYVSQGLATPTDWTLSRCLAAAAICQKIAGAGTETVGQAARELRRAARKPCMASRQETPLYLAASASLDLLDGGAGARAGFDKAVTVAREQGMVAQLLDVYRLGMRVWPEGSEERAEYAELEERLTTLVVQAPSPDISDLVNGALGPIVEPPLPSWLRD